MNIKSLLFGSAAALVAVSGARAADAVVVAEPEPAEYVRVCDVYGAGYFYIPGTETCLRIGGYVRTEVRFGDAGTGYGGRVVTDHLDGSANDTYSWRSRFTLKTWTGQETELGTLKTYTETRFNYNNGGQAGTSLNFAWIQLGGFRIGLDESAYSTFLGYAGNVIADDLVPYGPFDTNVVQYYFDAGNGFSAVVSLEQGNGDSYGHGYTIDSYVPHVVGGVKYTQGWGSVGAVASYDSVHEEWAVKARVDVNATEQLSLFLMAAYGSDDNPITHQDFNFYKPWGENWAVWGGASYQVNEKTALNAQLSYDEAENFGAAVNVAYTIVPGFTVTAELDYLNWDAPAGVDDDALSGLIRFQRSF